MIKPTLVKLILLVIVQVVILDFIPAQLPPSSLKFRKPMDIPLVVAGNFGEVRSNHFHTGIDFKTQGVSGKKVFAIEEGYVSRIGYSHYGYGKVLYITHPSGYTSVYAHLSKFGMSISTFVRNHQYSIQKETFTVYLDSTKIKVKKGQIIGLSGNSGSSFAPHLHFEIRETVSEHPMNPLLFGFKITDTKKPMINNLKIYPLDSNSLINGMHQSMIIPVLKNKKGKYYLKKSFTGYGNIGVALHSTDRLNARNICGLYSLDLSVDGKHLFGHTMRKLDFSTNRYVNHHVDYFRHKRYNNSFHKSFLRGNNKLNIYSHVDKGVVFVENDSIYKFHYTAKDYSGNKSTLSFRVKGDSTHLNNKKENERSCLQYLYFDEPNYFDTTNFSFLMTPNTLYENQCFNYSRKAGNNYLSDVHTLRNESGYLGIQQSFKIFITPNQLIDSLYREKLLIVALDKKGRISDRGGEYQLGKVTTRLREFGRFAVMMDTTNPVLTLLSKTDKLSKNSKLIFRIGDNLSGIQSYQATLDGVWILTRYDRKKSRWYISLSEYKNLSKGGHTLQVEVVDEKGNSNLQSIELQIN